jgi:hypothetical protein
VRHALAPAGLHHHLIRHGPYGLISVLCCHGTPRVLFAWRLVPAHRVLSHEVVAGLHAPLRSPVENPSKPAAVGLDSASSDGAALLQRHLPAPRVDRARQAQVDEPLPGCRADRMRISISSEHRLPHLRASLIRLLHSFCLPRRAVLQVRGEHNGDRDLASTDRRVSPLASLAAWSSGWLSAAYVPVRRYTV